MASRKAPKQATPKMSYGQYRSVRQRAGWERAPKVTRPLPPEPVATPFVARRMGASIAQLRELETEKTYFAREHDRAGRAGDVSTQRHYLHAYADAERRYLEHAQKHRHEYGTLAGTDPNEGKYRNRAPLGIAPRGNSFKPSQETMAARRASHVPQDK